MNDRQRALLMDVLRESRSHLFKIQSYLAERKIDSASQDFFQLGYLPNTNTIFEALKPNWSAEEAIAIALELKLIFATNESRHEYGSFLSNRLIFPVYDVYGRILALSGRSLDGKKPKYYNTAFSKRRHLYGLNHAFQSILDSGFAITVEGYMDVISSHRIDVKNVVAVMGTSFTDEHGILISRYAKNSFLLLDNDTAGKESTKKYTEEKLPDPLIMAVQPVVLPGTFKDIDEMISKNTSLARKFLTKDILRVK